MPEEAVLITGANGEIGHGLIDYLQTNCEYEIIALDVQKLDPVLEQYCHHFVLGDILNMELLRQIGEDHKIRTIYHLASLLSTRAERDPELAHNINVNGTLNLLELALKQGLIQNKPVKFIYPSSIAAYGLPDTEQKRLAGKIREDQWLQPTTMYGCNKLYCEHLGRYYTHYYGQIQPSGARKLVDFRALRFPGLISPVTLPTGGTTDYGPEMLHHAAQKKPYPCFVRRDTKLPFMVMSDAIKSIIMLENVPRESLTQCVYNVTSFSPTAEEFYDIVKTAFPSAEITFELDASRQSFVDTWPEDIDDSAARRDWGWEPDYDQQKAFDDLLIPAVRSRYGIS